MNQILEFFVLLFATVGLIACGRWIFRSGWGNVWKVVGIMVVVSLWWAMANGPLYGRWGVDHGELIDLVATFGIVIAATWGVRRVGNDWRHQTAVVVGALSLLLFMWVPRFNARGGPVPSIGHPASSSPRAGGTTPAHDDFDCSGLNPRQRVLAGCP